MRTSAVRGVDVGVGVDVDVDVDAATDFIGLPDPAHLFVSQKRNIEMIALLDSLLFSGRRCREALRSLRSVSCCLCGGHASGFSRCRGAWGRLPSEKSKSLFC